MNGIILSFLILFQSDFLLFYFSKKIVVATKRLQAKLRQFWVLNFYVQVSCSCETIKGSNQDIQPLLLWAISILHSKQMALILYSSEKFQELRSLWILKLDNMYSKIGSLLPMFPEKLHACVIAHTVLHFTTIHSLPSLSALFSHEIG